jgi:hypothetical protein
MTLLLRRCEFSTRPTILFVDANAYVRARNFMGGMGGAGGAGRGSGGTQ